MKKRVSLTLAVMMMSSVLASGQIAKWMIKPDYDNMFIAAGTDLIVTDSLGIQTALWTLDGKCLVRTDSDIHPFRDGLAVTTQRGTVALRGFYTDSGAFVPVKGGPFHIARMYPYLSGGHLLVEVPDAGLFRYVNTEGTPSGRYFVDAYPFFNGFASSWYYLNPEKMKDLYPCLLTEDMQPVPFSFNGKMIAPNDVEFLSSVNDEGLGVIVAKKKVYLFHAEDQSLSALGPTENSFNLKEQAKVETEFVQAFVQDSDTTWTFGGKCGKAGFVQLWFDQMKRPVAIRYVNGERVFKKHEKEVRELDSPLRATVVDDKYGIVWDGQEQLPPQFEDFPACFGDKAIVRIADKYGMLQMQREEQFQLSMYKGKDIPFKHQTFETTLRLDLPSYIPAEKASIEVDPSSGCEIDRTSGEARNTQFGNFVQFDCVLHIPDSLPDEETVELVYPTRVLYQGLVSSVIPLKVNAWHYKYFVVDVIDSETALDKGSLSFTFNINAERAQGEDIYPTVVNVQADSLSCALEKYSETRYKCRVQELREGLNNIVVQVIEQGCPPVSFPFEIFYTKPVAKTRNQPEVEEEVVIKKKESRSVKRTIPRVEM